MTHFERTQVREALARGPLEYRADRQRELRILEVGGMRETALVSAAIEDSMGGRQASIDRAVNQERERCAGIAGLWPDNLLAKEIGKRIRSGQ